MSAGSSAIVEKGDWFDRIIISAAVLGTFLHNVAIGAAAIIIIKVNRADGSVKTIYSTRPIPPIRVIFGFSGINP